MQLSANPPFSVNQQSEKRRFQEEGKYPFHSKRLPDYTAGSFREARPVRAKLEFHGNTSHDAHGEIDCENSSPEAGGILVGIVFPNKSNDLQDNNEKSQSHCQARKDVVKRDCKRKMQPMYCERRIHTCLPRMKKTFRVRAPWAP